MDLIIRYDPKADILAIKLREGAIEDEELLDSDVVLGLDGEGRVAALEIWEASKRGLLKALVDLASERREVAELILRKARVGSA
ncbi:MAG: DUF2283 domain-containing protein [Candidatus Korarchaeota archaeon]|nr:DUF2283 domain-containing protein [Candidatus Korarchaeota archaeon]